METKIKNRKKIYLLDNISETIPENLIILYCIFSVLYIILDILFSYSGILNNIINFSLTSIPFVLLAIEILKGKPYKKEFFSLIIFIAYSMIVAIIGIVMSSSQSKISLYGKYLVSLAFPIFLYVIFKQKFTKKNIDLLFKINVFLTVVLLLKFFIEWDFNYRNSIINGGSLCLGFYNSNYAAMILMGNLLILLLSLSHYKSYFSKMLNIVLALFLLYLLYLTNSRTSFFVTLIVIFFMSIHFNIKKWHVFIIILIPILFFLFYLSVRDIDILNNIIIMGKPIFSGREELWEEILIDFYNGPVSIIFGNYKISLLTNAHNGFLTILVNYGIVGFVIYYINIYIQFRKIIIESNSSLGVSTYLCVLLGFMLLTISEAGLTIMGGAFMIYIIISLAYIKYIILNSRCCFLGE